MSRFGLWFQDVSGLKVGDLSQPGAIIHALLACPSVTPEPWPSVDSKASTKAPVLLGTMRIEQVDHAISCYWIVSSFKRSPPFQPADQEWDRKIEEFIDVSDSR